MRLDEPGDQIPPARVHDRRARTEAALDVTDGRYPVAEHRDVGPVDLPRVDVHELAAADDKSGRPLAQSHCDQIVALHHNLPF